MSLDFSDEITFFDDPTPAPEPLRPRQIDAALPSAVRPCECTGPVSVATIPVAGGSWAVVCRRCGRTPREAPAPVPAAVVTPEWCACALGARTTGAYLGQSPGRSAYACGTCALPIRLVLRAVTVAAPVPVAPVAPAPTVTASALVAGVAEGSIGSLVSWTGAGILTRAAILGALRIAGLWESEAPAPLSPKAQIAEVLARLNLRNGRRYVVRAAPSRERAAGTPWVGRWTVATSDGTAAVGDSAGTVALVVSVTADGVLTILGGQDTDRERIRSEYMERLGAESYDAGHVSEWLTGVLHRRCAVRQGSTWMVPARHAKEIGALVEALSANWGRDWMVPMIPLVTTDALRTSLGRAFTREAREIVDEAYDALAAASSAGKSLPDRTATSLITRLEGVAARVRFYSEALGSESMVGIERDIKAVIAAVEPYSSDVARRFALIFEDIGGAP